MTERERPAFWWEPPAYLPPENCAPTGWYKWTHRGLVYLGTSLPPPSATPFAGADETAA